jgi:hypothetical protein
LVFVTAVFVTAMTAVYGPPAAMMMTLRQFSYAHAPFSTEYSGN